MAEGKLFGLDKIKSIVDKFFKLFDNFIDGYSVTQNKVTERSGGVTSSMILTTDINGEKVNVRVDLTATNVGSVFNKTTRVINNLDYGALSSGITDNSTDDVDDTNSSVNIEGRSRKQRKQNQKNNNNNNNNNSNNSTFSVKSKQVVDMIQTLVGKGALKRDNTGKYYGDISLEAAMQRGYNGGIEGGILGINLQKVAEKQLFDSPSFKYWREKAFKELQYTLMCETDTDDAGKVSNQKLNDCAQWVSRYIAYIESHHGKSGETSNDEDTSGTTAESPDFEASTSIDKPAILAKQLSAEEKQANEQNTKLIANVLVMPILIEIQAQLRNIYQQKLNEDTSLDTIIDHDAEYSEEDMEEQYKQEEAEDTSEDLADELEDTFTSKKINITLKKIQASDELSILSLNSNYLPGDTLSDIDEIVNQEDFLNTLTEEPQSFAIEVDDDGFDIEPCEACQSDPCASLCEVFKSGIRAYRNLYILHWMSAGNDMMKLHLMTEEMYEELQGEIDTLGELLVEKQGTVPQLDFPCDYIPVQKYDFQTGLDQIKSLIQMYIDCIDYAYCNQDSDVQSTLDEWLRYWNKQINYFIKRQEV